MKQKMILRVLFCCSCFVKCIFGVTLGPCVENGIAEVRDDQANTFYCRGLQAQDTVQWTFVYDQPNIDPEDSLGLCPALPASCQPGIFGPSYTAKRTSDTESVMTIDHRNVTPGQPFLHQGTLLCKIQTTIDASRCAIDLITSSQGSTCTVTFDQALWRTTGRCVVSSRTSSSRGRYNCRWYRTRWGSSDVIQFNTSYSASNKVCTLNEIWPDDGLYNFTVKITPGETYVTATFNGTQEIRRPSTSTTVSGCSGTEYVLENSTVNCTCQTSSVGLPAGRLQWLSGVSNTIEITGQPGDTSLLLTTYLSRADHQTRQLRCNILWRTSLTGTPLTFNVGYKPENVAIMFDTPTNKNASENSVVRITCSADGRPTVTLTLVKVGKGELNRQNITLIQELKNVTCFDTGLYSCSARNQFDVAGISQWLFVNCKPRSQDKMLSAINFREAPVIRYFELTAHPAPTTFLFLRPDLNDTTGTTSPAGLQQSVTCAQKSVNVYYDFICTLTVSNVTRDASGRYTLRVNNSEGFEDLTVNITLDICEQCVTDESFPWNVGLIIGLPVGLGLPLVVIITAVVCLWRKVHRNANGNNNSSNGLETTSREAQQQERGQYDTLRTSVMGTEGSYADLNQQVSVDRQSDKDRPGLVRGFKTERSENFLVYENLDSDPVRTANVAHSTQAGNYDSLQMWDVGQRSPYAELHPSHSHRERGREFQ